MANSQHKKPNAEIKVENKARPNYKRVQELEQAQGGDRQKFGRPWKDIIGRLVYRFLSGWYSQN